jgi:hypothetical protein
MDDDEQEFTKVDQRTAVRMSADEVASNLKWIRGMIEAGQLPKAPAVVALMDQLEADFRVRYTPKVKKAQRRLMLYGAGHIVFGIACLGGAALASSHFNILGTIVCSVGVAYNGWAAYKALQPVISYRFANAKKS